jgi:hypothetical protein
MHMLAPYRIASPLCRRLSKMQAILAYGHEAAGAASVGYVGRATQVAVTNTQADEYMAGTENATGGPLMRRRTASHAAGRPRRVPEEASTGKWHASGNLHALSARPSTASVLPKSHRTGCAGRQRRLRSAGELWAQSLQVVGRGGSRCSLRQAEEVNV